MLPSAPSPAASADVDEALDRLGAPATAESAAQACVSAAYERMAGSLALLRIFTTVRLGELTPEGRAFVERGAGAHAATSLRDDTRVLALLGSRGREPAWNARTSSRRFQCIPLASGPFVASLSMLHAQLAAMGFDDALVERWPDAFAGGARYDGTLHVRDARVDRDAQGRFLVPARDFVEGRGIRAVLGFGTSLTRVPALAILFAFATEPVDAPPPILRRVLDAYRRLAEPLIAAGRVFDA